MASDRQRIRKNGIYYTPDKLAQALAVELFRGHTGPPPSILDPACGEGVLLWAAKNVCDSLLPRKVARAATLLGCDLYKPSRWPEDMRLRFQKCDFFALPYSTQFDAVIMNPPYVQFGGMDAKEREDHYIEFGRAVGLSRMADMWTYFMLKAMGHLRTGGSLAAVVPWSLLEAQYAHSLREHLARHFHVVRVLVLRDRHFDSTEKRVLLLWLKGFGRPAERIEVAFSGTIEEKHVFRRITAGEWGSPGVLACHGLETAQILEDLREAGFRRLGDVAEVAIGVVTGANAFFIVPVSEAGAMGFSTASRTPIITTVRELRGLELNAVPDGVLLQFKPLTARKRAYLRLGKRSHLDERSHCSRRSGVGKRWYDVDPGPVPDAFFTYRVSKLPFLALNPQGCQCTNSIHKVRFRRGVSANARKWIQLSLLSDAGQLSLEIGVRHYGSGALKIEPYILKEALVHASSEAIPTDIYDRISEAVAGGRKEEASEAATLALKQVSGLKLAFWKELASTLREVRRRRNGVGQGTAGTVCGKTQGAAND